MSDPREVFRQKQQEATEADHRKREQLAAEKAAIESATSRRQYANETAAEATAAKLHAILSTLSLPDGSPFHVATKPVSYDSTIIVVSASGAIPLLAIDCDEGMYQIVPNGKGFDNYDDLQAEALEILANVTMEAVQKIGNLIHKRRG